MKLSIPKILITGIPNFDSRDKCNISKYGIIPNFVLECKISNRGFNYMNSKPARAYDDFWGIIVRFITLEMNEI